MGLLEIRNRRRHLQYENQADLGYEPGACAHVSYDLVSCQKRYIKLHFTELQFQREASVMFAD